MKTAKNFNCFIYTTLALSVVLIASSVCQAGFQEGVAAYRRGDYKIALKEFRILAEQGDATAQTNLGNMYDNGEGVPEDDTEAVKWYRKAAEQGHATAQYNLGLMYANGEGVPEDDTRAYAWFNLAAAQSNKNAIKGKELLRKRMTPTQIAEAQKLSHTLFERIHGK